MNPSTILRRAAVPALAALALLPAAASAQNLVGNGSFETPVVPTGFSTFAGGSTAMAPWTIDSGSIDIIHHYWESDDGDQSLDMSGSAAGAISQSLATEAGEQYLVSFALAANYECGAANKQLRVAWEGDVVAEPVVNPTGRSSADMGWKTLSYVVTADDTASELAFTSLTADFCGPALDTVRVEPLGASGQVTGSGLLTSTIAAPNDFSLSATTSPVGGSVLFRDQATGKTIEGDVVCVAIDGNEAYLVYRDAAGQPVRSTPGGVVHVQDNGPNAGAPVDKQRNGRIARVALNRALTQGCSVPATGPTNTIAGGDITVVPAAPATL